MSPPGRSGPSRQPDDRKRQAPRMDGKSAKRCFGAPPVLIPPKARPVFLAPIPIAPAVPSNATYQEPSVAPSSSMQATHQVQSLPFSVGNTHPAPMQQHIPLPRGSVNVVAQNGVRPNSGLPAFPHSVSAPHIFKPSKLRSGKWHLAEERYADILIDLFDRGLTVECENGATLRSFLSRKLHCSPMRISKKYAGKGIGKKVFLSKRNNQALQTISREDTRDAIAKLKLAEAKFYNSLFPGSNLLHVENHCHAEARMTSSSGFRPRLAPFPPLPAQPHAIVPASQVHGISSGLAMSRPPSPTAFVQVGADAARGPGHGDISRQSAIPQVANAVLVVKPTPVLQGQRVGETVTSQVLPLPCPKSSANAVDATVVALVAASEIATTTDSPGDTHTVKLHESYLSALKDMEGATKRPKVPNMITSLPHNPAVAANSQTVNTNKNLGAPMIDLMASFRNPVPQEPTKDIKTHLEHKTSPLEKATWSISIASNKCDQAHPPGIRMTEPSMSTTVHSSEIMHTNSRSTELAAPSTSNTSDLKLSDGPAAVLREKQQSKQIRQLTSQDFAELRPSISDTKELPDLLVGFDHASRLVSEQDQSYLSTVQTWVADSACQHSPPFTSRSFDDFHCLLGKDLAPLNGELERAQGGQAGKIGNGRPRKRAASVVQPSNALSAGKPMADSAVLDADHYQQLSAAASEHSAFVPHINMFDTTHEHLFYSNLSGSLKAPGLGDAREFTGEQGAKCERGVPSLQSTAAQSATAWFSSSQHAAAVISGSEKSVSGYCSSVNEAESLE